MRSRKGALAIFAGVSTDLFSDSVMIGTGTVVNPAFGLLLALEQVPADVPEGFVAVATMRNAGIKRQSRMLLPAGFAVPILAGAAIGYLALRGPPEVLTLSVLALAGGALVAVVVEEMVSEAHAGETSQLEPVLLTVGFALFAAVSVYLGGPEHTPTVAAGGSPVRAGPGRRRGPGRSRAPAWTRAEADRGAGQRQGVNTGCAGLVFGVAALATLVAGVTIGKSGEQFFGDVGRSGILFGSTLLAAATSLPEIWSTVCATGGAAARGATLFGVPTLRHERPRPELLL